MSSFLPCGRTRLLRSEHCDAAYIVVVVVVVTTRPTVDATMTRQGGVLIWKKQISVPGSTAAD
jgi:hypothetical protein